MFLFIQGIIILICLSILSVYIANIKIGMRKRRKKIAISHCGESKDHKDVVRDALDYNSDFDRIKMIRKWKNGIPSRMT